MPHCLLRDRWGKLDASAYRGLEDLTLYHLPGVSDERMCPELLYFNLEQGV